MGMYVNPGADSLEMDMAGDFYIDKSLVLTVLNKKYRTPDRFMCVSRPRRFGKTMLGNLIAAYYSRDVDSRPIFEKLHIASKPDWDVRLNKCNVLQIDLGSFYNIYYGADDVIAMLNKIVVAEMREEFPDVTIRDGAPLPEAIITVFGKTKVPFVVIIDEYDCMVRENVSQKVFASYLAFLNGLFKSAECGRAIGLSYITGIIPIVRDKMQSKLNNFKEYTMLSPRDLAPYVGFTKPEVKSLCEKYGMDYDECLRWYDGYRIAPLVDICNSNSVCEAMSTRKFDDYWSKTGAYAAISDYIRMDFKGVKQDIATMIGGGSVPVNVSTFTNVLSDLGDKDKVFTYLIHLGYLAYNKEQGTCCIPNGEVRTEWEHAIADMEDMSKVFEMVQNSKALLEATLNCDEKAVARALRKAHSFVTSAKEYNNEGALQSAVGLAYFSATSKYDINREMPAGEGFADLAFIPHVQGVPGIIVELKMDKKPDVGLAQIKEKGYADCMRNYRGPILLVAISYDKAKKTHTCKIEKAEA